VTKVLLTHLLSHGVTETCKKYHAFLYGHVLDDVSDRPKNNMCVSGNLTLPRKRQQPYSLFELSDFFSYLKLKRFI